MDAPKLLMISHFEATSSGDKSLLMGKPWPPVRCHLVWAAHPPLISKRAPVVSSFAESGFSAKPLNRKPNVVHLHLSSN